MRSNLIVALFIVHIGYVVAQPMTRMIYNNSNCDAPYIGYTYSPKAPTGCVLSGCTEVVPGTFWAMEDCVNTPTNYDYYVAVQLAMEIDCRDFLGEVGGLPDVCFVIDQGDGTTAYKLSNCGQNQQFNIGLYNDTTCSESGKVEVASVSASCETFGLSSGLYGQTFLCPPSPPMAPVAAPLASPQSSNGPTSSPVSPAAPTSTQAPASSPVKKSSNGVRIMESIFVLISGLLVLLI